VRGVALEVVRKPVEVDAELVRRREAGDEQQGYEPEAARGER
jgi:hypothetical protein